MDLFENIVKKLTDAADYTLKEAGKLTDTAKTKISIASKEAAIEDELLKIGRYCYDEHADAAINNSDVIQMACSEIDKLTGELKNLNDELAVLKKFKICNECGTKIDRDMSYCHKCGHQQ
jgi:hypothetical protein